MKPVRETLTRICLGRRGQAMAEYSTITGALLLTTGFLLVQFLPVMITAIGDYMHGYYFMMALPIP